jgi:membrane fusion protein, multidrug efflux system
VKRLLQTILLVTCAMPVADSAAPAIKQAPAPTVEIQSVVLRQKQVSDLVTGLGAVAASDEATTDISFLHAGEVTSLDVQTGERVRKGQRLAELTADPTAVQNFDKAVAALNFAKQDLERTRTLLAQHLATNAQLATAQKAYDDAVTAVATERKIGDDKPTELAAAPFDGFVVKLMVALGDRIQQNTPLMKLARTDVGARIVVGLPADQASRVTPGMDATITAIMNAKPQQMAAKVGGVSDSVNPASRLIDCWLTLSHASDRIAEGTTVNVTIVVAQHLGWVVPRQSVLKDHKGSYIFQSDGAVARRVDVQTGIETDEETEISGAFDQTKPVVTQGNYELQDGMKVREAVSAPPK